MIHGVMSMKSSPSREQSQQRDSKQIDTAAARIKAAREAIGSQSAAGMWNRALLLLSLVLVNEIAAFWFFDDVWSNPFGRNEGAKRGENRHLEGEGRRRHGGHRSDEDCDHHGRHGHGGHWRHRHRFNSTTKAPGNSTASGATGAPTAATNQTTIAPVTAAPGTTAIPNVSPNQTTLAPVNQTPATQNP